MARPLRCTVEQCRVAAVEAVGSHQTHLGPVREENVVLKHSKSKRMRSLSPAIEDYFPGRECDTTEWPSEKTKHGCITVFLHHFQCNLYLSRPS